MEYRNHTWGPDCLSVSYTITKDGYITLTDWKTPRNIPYRPTLDEQEQAKLDIQSYRKEMLK